MQFFARIKPTSSVHGLWSRMGKKMAALHGVVFVRKAGEYVSGEIKDAKAVLALRNHEGVEVSAAGASVPGEVSVAQPTPAKVIHEAKAPEVKAPAVKAPEVKPAEAKAVKPKPVVAPAPVPAAIPDDIDDAFDRAGSPSRYPG
ncbi:MAG: hypothetical protein ACYCOU_15295 [Sulfobacillus sp.]